MKTRLKSWLILAIISLGSTFLVWAKVGLDTVYKNFDGIYYLVVAKTWYDKEEIGKQFEISLPAEYYTAHFPAFPALINLGTAFGLNRLQAMLVVNVLVTMAGAVTIYEVFSRKKWGNPGWAAIAWLFWWPRMWAVRSVGSPETLFILACVLSLWWFSEKRYWLAGVAGAVAAATKSPGILLAVAYGLWAIETAVRTKKIPWKIFPVGLIGLASLAVFGFYAARTGDFWAYFHSGDNIHLQPLPWGIFNSDQPWVGTWWLDDVIWVYLVGAVGVVRAFAKDRVWGWFGAVFGTTLLFVAHRDVTRYALPLMPVVLLGLAELWQKKEVRWITAAVVAPLYFYTVNFVAHNGAAVASLAPFL